MSTGQHEAAATQYRISVMKLASTGGAQVKKAAQAALDDNSPEKLVEFIATGQDKARLSDERVQAMRLMSTGGPELKSAAQVALEGSPDLLRAFITVGQHKAQRKDQLAATHEARIQGLLGPGRRVGEEGHSGRQGGGPGRDQGGQRRRPRRTVGPVGPDVRE
ncbi:ALF repeat-containing protein [Streptomyces monomycini]|uniref:ALF repeat-containing protein n=1 Tax=Streptomyces monomycini TaxID=371720 RepID=UPI000A97D052|nr:ALF repeat-containing protein [Streptomyces monomycini]